MPTEKIAEYEIEFVGLRMREPDGWAAQMAVYGPSTNPMHRKVLVALQRVAVYQLFPTQHDAEQEARLVALAMFS
ncbi:MAG: hypothetical protein V4508_17265 [Pseudomonadota bacterium]